MPLVPLLVLFIVVPLVELYVIIEVVGEAIGAPLTILLLAVDSVLGSLLLRSQGRAVWRRFNEALHRGGVPHREVVDGALVIVGGALLITPGFVTDLVGVALLIPPTRVLVRRAVLHRLRDRMVASAERAARGPRRAADVEGTAVDADEPEPSPRPARLRS